MKKVDVLIIGGGPGGITSASFLKELHPRKSITLIRKEELVLMPSGIPYIFGTLGGSNKDVAMHDAGMEKDGVEILIDEVIRIDVKLKICTTKSRREIQYDKLVLATGSFPIKSDIPGNSLENVFIVPKDKAYIDKMHTALSVLQNVVIIGGGSTGIGLADELRKTGKIITLVEQAPQLLGGKYDIKISKVIVEALQRQGIKVCLGVTAEKIAGIQTVQGVLLSDGVSLVADAVIFALGHTPNTALAEQAGVSLDEFGAVQVDHYMNTTISDVLAIGDCAGKTCFVSGKPVQAMLASVACTEARIAATTMYRTDVSAPISGTVAVMMSKAGGVAFGMAGLSEAVAEQHGLAIRVSAATGIDKHPASLPNTHDQFVKLIADANTGIIVGGEVLGSESIGELLNIIALAIQRKATAYDLFTMHVGTHPLLTGAPGHYIIINAAKGLIK